MLVGKSNVLETRLIVTLSGTHKGATMAGLLTEIQSEPRNQSGRTRRIHEIADQLDAVDRDEFMKALDDRDIPAIAIVRVMTRRGFVLSETQVSNHRRGLYATR